MQFLIKPTVKLMNSVNELFSEYKLSKNDLVVTNEYIISPFIKENKPECHFLYQEKFGKGEPSDEMIDAMLDAVRGLEIERIFAIGGGTVIDISKLFVFGGDYTCADLYEFGSRLEKKRKLVIIPTTCGTGSEMTCLTIAEIKKKHTKLGLNLPQLYADETVLIDEFLYTIPYGVFATSSIDALIHAIESYVSNKRTVYSDLFADKAIDMIISGYKKIAENGKDEVKKNIHDFIIAADMAGIAFSNAGCGAVHATSYPVGANFHVPHGLANYIMFNACFKAYEKNGADMTDAEAAIRRSLNVGEGVNVWAALTELLDKILERKPLKEVGMTQENISEFASTVLQTQTRLLNNMPVTLSMEDLEEIYRECF